MKHRIFSTLICAVSFLILSCTILSCTADEPPALTQTAAWEGTNASIVLSLPEDWSWNLFPESEEDAHLGDGIRFYPDNDPTAFTVVRFDDGFGVCGTGLKTEAITLAGGPQITSYAWDGGIPSLYRFEGTPGTYLADLQMDREQRGRYFDTVMQILDSAVLGGDMIRRETAIFLTGHAADEQTRIYARFDAVRGVWVIEIYSQKTKPETHTFTFEVSADGTSVHTVFQRNKEASA